VANIKSQIKRNRQNDKRRLRNRVYRGTARITVKDARSAIEAGVPESKEALTSAVSALDKAVEQGVLHKNNAARRKSRLMKAFNKMEPVKVEAEAAVEPVAQPEPKKSGLRRRIAKTEPKVEAPEEPKAEVTSSPKGKKAATLKTAAKKAAATKAKKPAVKKKE
jgi:small subunit ribosomal protein S20